MIESPTSRLLTFSVVLLGALSLGDSAWADPGVLPVPGMVPAKADDFYISFGGIAQAFDLPKFNHYTLAASGANLFGRQPEVAGGGGAGVLGYQISGLPDWMGDHPRIELALSGFQGSANDSSGTTGSFTVHVTSIDGTSSYTGGFVRSAYTGKLKTSYNDFEIGPRMKTNMRVAPDVTLTPSVAALYGVSHTGYKLSFNQTITGGFLPGSVHENVDTWRSGPEIGLDATWQPVPSWSFHAGATVAEFYQHAALNGNDCASNFALAAGAACDGSAFATTVSKNDGRLGARFGQSIGATYDWNPVKITAMAVGSWTQNVAGVRNPNVSGDTAKIIYSDGWSYGGLLMVTIPLSSIVD